ncbi:MAG TPA: metallophosphoesterase [Acidimicrobiales bacterium]|nr:metallophosphoesterase [Acidimicrobiales bacterium]
MSTLAGASVRAVELTTVADDEVVLHVPASADRQALVIARGGLAPDREHEVEGVVFRTLPRPPGERLATLATVNDVHFGEVECGVLEGNTSGPVLRVGPGETPYPDIMNRSAVQEIAAIEPDVVLAKGDLTTHGTVDELEAFLSCYLPVFGERLHYVRGNHDAGADFSVVDGGTMELKLPGVTLAVLDTTIPGRPSGRVDADQLDWLDELGSRADRLVLVFGHHHPWDPSSRVRPDTYFGINPADSEALVAVIARRPSLVGYFAGHTHRNRVRRFAPSGEVPYAEVACVKDFPGTWAEYRVFEGGILQVHRRISTPEALAWSDGTRIMFGGFYAQYAFGQLSDRCFPIWPRPS